MREMTNIENAMVSGNIHLVVHIWKTGIMGVVAQNRVCL